MLIHGKHISSFLTHYPLCDGSGEVRTISLNSCLAVVGSLDGMAVTTVEGIGKSESGLHGVQGAFLDWGRVSHRA